MQKRNKVFVVSSVVNEGIKVVEGAYSNISAAEEHVLHLFSSCGYIPNSAEKDKELSKLLFSRGGDEYYMYLARKGMNSLTVIVNALELLERFDEVAK